MLPLLHAKGLVPQIGLAYGRQCGEVYLTMFFFSLALTTCYTEYEVKYNLENAAADLANLNAAETDKEQRTFELCRNYCRHLNSFKFHGSQ